ncbi:putative UDP-rhamnose/UDP-galactose transporter 6 [Blattamonas nauphoetae]|uniref:UDP-rhamnose/UDP-galactose transporter 6 n=1 Tax=Blattamonas nauphoetae TaxID=2049346 RepID=A0ABQ9Y2K0_9EUKA|nr:putative UDP-rhamnose/UDP-galactose transporter 6 [Blattamonas nauphoetae]
MKIAVTPCVCVIEMLFYKKRFPITVLLSIVTIIVGVGLCTGASLQTEPLGFIVGAAGAVSTALYQIWSKTTQKKLDCNEFQLLLYETPMAAVLVAVIAYFTENYNLSSPTSIWNQHYTPILITKIICTAIGSVGINITLFVGINRTSPLTYNVVSHLKTISIIVLGTILFQEQLTSKRLIGMVVAIGGIVLYSVSNKPQSGGQKQERNSPSPTKTRPKRPDEDDKDTVRIRRAAKSSRTPTRK